MFLIVKSAGMCLHTLWNKKMKRKGENVGDRQFNYH